ncbi:MAG: type II/IV secretion system ATPase subunit [Candidatus Diapherotrites archaeon]|nr:type II/IV secretion system ATPase subunit [Candidatus Diapherotrites archaeon]
MKIKGLQVGEYAVKTVSGKRDLVFDCKHCPYGASISDDYRCRFHVFSGLGELDADLIVFAEVYERVYEEKQVGMLTEIARLGKKFENEAIWSSGNLGLPEFEKNFGERHDALVTITHELISYDPISAYLQCLQELKRVADLAKSSDENARKDWLFYLKTLNYVKEQFEKTVLIDEAKKVLIRLKEIPDSRDFYRMFFDAQIKPAFIGSRLAFEQKEDFELLDDYVVAKSSVQIFKHPNKPQKMYFINPPEYSLPPEKYGIWSEVKGIVHSLKPGKINISAISKSRKYFERIYEGTIMDTAKKYNIKLTAEEISELAEIVARYTVGYGILEILLSDRHITDIYLDAPIGAKPIYIVHSEFGQCVTNISYSEEEASALISKLRAMSGRPFDESHPVLDFDLEELQTRVAVIGPPLSPDGAAFAFRLHKTTPWTLCQFVDNKMITPLGAGLLSFFVDNQATMLVTGSRGSGKTSLMQALMLEIPQNSRILVQEDTLEIPVPYMKEIGFNIQRLKTRSPISVSRTETEVAPEESLRTALRLGDSALILGEVRSLEAKVLYEAMRVGAAGNIVMGTIHGDSAYSVWDRVVNDLGVPNTSFKATDLVVVARPIRFSGSLERVRRVSQVTEVKKHWISDPEREGGLLDLMLYDTKKDNLDLLEDNLKESDLFSKLSKISGLTMQEMWQSIRMNASSKEFLVKLRQDLNLPEILEAENTVIANNKLLLLKQDQIEKFGSVDYDAVLGEWKNWTREVFAKRLSVKKK